MTTKTSETESLKPGIYRITYKGMDASHCQGLWKYVRSRPHHCQLHGERIGTQHLFQKRKRSAARPWSHVNYMFTDTEYQFHFERAE